MTVYQMLLCSRCCLSWGTSRWKLLAKGSHEWCQMLACNQRLPGPSSCGAYGLSRSPDPGKLCSPHA